MRFVYCFIFGLVLLLFVDNSAVANNDREAWSKELREEFWKFPDRPSQKQTEFVCRKAYDKLEENFMQPRCQRMVVAILADAILTNDLKKFLAGRSLIRLMALRSVGYPGGVRLMEAIYEFLSGGTDYTGLITKLDEIPASSVDDKVWQSFATVRTKLTTLDKVEIAPRKERVPQKWVELSDKLFLSIFRSHINSLRPCLEGSFNQMGRWQGHVWFEADFARGSKITGFRVAEREMKRTNDKGQTWDVSEKGVKLFAACVEKKFRQWKFPPAKDPVTRRFRLQAPKP